MSTTILTKTSAAIEAITGVALIATPERVARVLLGAELSGSGIAVARVAGFALLALGLACWPSNHVATPQATRALFIYNLLAGLYFGYLRVGGGFVSYLLWPACVLHVALGCLLARPVLDGVSSVKANRAGQQ
jgi:hypothetical protein